MGKLEAVRTTDSFAELIEKNGILSVKQLEQAKKACQESADLKTAARRVVNEKLITLWQANQLLKGSTGLMRGKFKLLDELGGGGVERTFLAEHGQLGRRVVLKTLSGRHKNDAEAVQNFLSQAQVVATLDHRNLIHIYDIGNEDDRHYVVTEYAEGLNFEKLVAKRGPLPISQAAEVIRQAALGLAHAHDRGVWHGELKPSALILDQQNTVKILDIGVAKLKAIQEVPLEESTAEESTDIRSFFRAPERQAHRNEGATTADIYSLGGIFYFLLTGRPPAARPLHGKWVREEQPAPLASLRKGLPHEIGEICWKMMEEDPSQRLQSASECATLLETWLAEEGDSSALDADELKGVADVDAAQSGTTAVSESKSFPTKSGPPPVRKGVPKAKPLMAKPLPDDTLDAPAGSSSLDSLTLAGEAASAGEEAREFSITPKKPAMKSKNAAAAESVAITSDESLNESSFSFDTTPKVTGKKTSFTKIPAKKKPSKVGGAKTAAAKPSQKVLIIGGATAAALLLLIASGMTYWFLSGSKTKVVAKAPARSTKENRPDETKADEKADDKPVLRVEEPAKKEEKPETMLSVEAKKPEVAVAATTSETTATLPVATADAPMKPEVAPPEAPPEPPPPTIEVAASNDSPSNPPAVDPFMGFVTEVSLPALGNEAAPHADALKPFELGTLKIDKQALCILQLLGTDFAIRGGKQKFVIEAGDGGTALRDWEVFLRDASANGGGTKIAALGLHDDKLTFVWQREAIAQKGAPFLCNCILQMSAASKSHTLALRKVVEREPISLDLSKLQSKTITLKFPLAPDSKRIRVRLTVASSVSRSRFDPSHEFDADKGFTYADFSADDKNWILKLRVDSILKTDLQMTIAPMFQLEVMEKPEALTIAALKAMPRTVDGRLTAMSNAMNNNANKGNAPPAKMKMQKQTAAAVQREVRTAQKVVEQVSQLEELLKSVSSDVKIHYEVVYKTDSKDLVLVTTHPPVSKTVVATE